MSGPVLGCALAFAACLSAQPSNLQVISVTTQQAVVQYTSPDANPCTLAMTDNSGMGVTVWDVNSSIFSNAN